MSTPDERSTRLRNRILFILSLIGIGCLALYFVLTSWRQPAGPPVGPESVTPTPTIPMPIPSTPPPPATLRWIAPAGVVLDGSVLKPGKEVELEELYHDDIGPKYFYVFEVYDSLFDWLINRYGSFDPRVEFPAKKLQAGTARSDGRWSLPAPSEFRGQSTFHFTDDRGNWSRWISSTSVVKLYFRLPPEFELQKETREAGTYQVKVRAVLEGEMIFASDPEVCLVVMVPWGKEEANLEEYLSQYLGYLREYNADIRPGAFLEHFEAYLPSEQLEGWELGISPQTIAGDPSEPGRFTLRLTTPTPGKTFLAVRAIDCEDPSRFVVSDIIGIEGAPY